MMNYIKSEFYRVSHTRGIYLFTGGLVVLAVILNAAIYYLGNQYAISSYSYSHFVASPMLFALMGSMIAFFLYEESHKNGNLKNTVASGISRIKIFAGECIVSTAISTLVMILTLGAWIVCTELLFEKAGPVQLNDLLLEIPMIYLISVASLISSIVFIEIFEKSIIRMVMWFLIWITIPQLLMYVGFRFEMVHDIAMWLPNNFFQVTNGTHVNMRECITVWDTTEGVIKCVLSGVIGIAVFSILGAVCLRKKDL